MSATTFILFPHGPTWQIATVTGGRAAFHDMLPPEAGTPVQNVAQHLAEEFRRLGYTGQPVMLALASADCLAAAIDVTGLPRSDRKAMLYRLEEKLPVAAESVVADFALADNQALGVCVREDAVAPLLHSLESFGVAIQSITPAALLAAQQLAENGGPQVLLIGDADQVNVIAIRQGVPQSWSLLPARLADLRLHLDLLAMESGEDAPIRAAGLQGLSLDALGAQVIPIVPRQAAAIAAAAALEGRLAPWIEFRRGALAISDRLRLHRKALDVFLAAAAIFLVCLTLGLLWRAHRYHREAQAADRQTADEFTATFPGWSLPSNVRTVVESEHRKLATRGSGTLPPEVNESALRTLHVILSRLPPEVKFKVEHGIFNDTSIEIEGRVRSFNDVDALASAARQAGLDVPPPQARRDNEGFWTFTLRGSRRPKPLTGGPVASKPQGVSDTP
jgi:type II secretory pathway component PulL